MSPCGNEKFGICHNRSDAFVVLGSSFHVPWRFGERKKQPVSKKSVS